MFKHTDDTNLHVPENTDVKIFVEFDNVLDWAANNFMITDVDKTKKYFP